MEWVSFLEKGNISFKLLLPIAILTGCLIFLPADIKALLSVDLFANKYKEYIGPVFLISTVLVSLNIIVVINTSATRSNSIKKIRTEIIANINSLTHQEKSLLREFFLQGLDALPLPLQDATVASLAGKNIIYQVSSYGGLVYNEICFNYSITKTAKKYITPQLIGLPVNMTKEDKQYLQSTRPKWLRDKYSY